MTVAFSSFRALTAFFWIIELSPVSVLMIDDDDVVVLSVVRERVVFERKELKPFNDKIYRELRLYFFFIDLQNFLNQYSENLNHFKFENSNEISNHFC